MVLPDCKVHISYHTDSGSLHTLNVMIRHSGADLGTAFSAGKV